MILLCGGCGRPLKEVDSYLYACEDCGVEIRDIRPPKTGKR